MRIHLDGKVISFKEILTIFVFTILFATGNAFPKIPMTGLLRTGDMENEWELFRDVYIENGQVVTYEGNKVSTSEGQSYALLGAVWANDKQTFDKVWKWTKGHLQVRGDYLFVRKWQNRVLDKKTNSGADVDIALALLLASKRFGEGTYAREAHRIMHHIWENEVIEVGNYHILCEGSWATKEEYPAIRVGRLAPYAFQMFAEADPVHPWMNLVNSTYDILRWIYKDKKLSLPPEVVYVDPERERFLLQYDFQTSVPRFGTDAMPVFWRIALDKQWYNRDKEEIYDAMLKFFKVEWQRKGALYYHYDLYGTIQTKKESVQLYASLHALAQNEDAGLARQIWMYKLKPLWRSALQRVDVGFTMHSWVMFNKAIASGKTRHFSDQFDVWLPYFDCHGLMSRLPLEVLGVAVVLFLLLSIVPKGVKKNFKIMIVATCGVLALYYFGWRIFETIHMNNPVIIIVSSLLLTAELYVSVKVFLSLVHYDFTGRPETARPNAPDYNPEVAIVVPCTTEPLPVIEKTLLAANAIEYPGKRVYICDDSQRDAVKILAFRLGVTYLDGPQVHGKAGNLNNTLFDIEAELIAVLNPDHIPVRSFLKETVPYFVDATVGFVQTPFHSYNADIFQRTFGLHKKVANENDHFEHLVQNNLGKWGGAIFTGTGAVIRREALESIGGFKIMNIADDIHTSQCLHVKGWKSVHVDKDLAAGLASENYRSYLMKKKQRMLGYMHIFLFDNPLFCKNLSFRHRLSYFSLLFQFLFPLPRLLFLLAPLSFLLFNHNLFGASAPVILAHLLPYLTTLAFVIHIVRPRWPQVFVGALYETAIAIPMTASLIGAFFLSKKQRNGIPYGTHSRVNVSQKQTVTLVMVLIGLTAYGITKSIIELLHIDSGYEVYYLYIAWSVYSIALLCGSLFILLERPHRRIDTRLAYRIPCVIIGEKRRVVAHTIDISMSGLSVEVEFNRLLPRFVTLELGFETPLRINALLKYQDTRTPTSSRCGYNFEIPNLSIKKRLFMNLFCSPKIWVGAHDKHPKNSIALLVLFMKGILYACRPPQKQTRRFAPRHMAVLPAKAIVNGVEFPALVRDSSITGMGMFVASRDEPRARQWSIRIGSDINFLMHVYTKKVAPYIWRVGLERKQTQKVIDKLETHNETFLTDATSITRN